MPKGDRTGPSGRGAMSGRAAGSCAGVKAPGGANQVSGRGGGFGGGGRGWRNWFHATGIPGWMRFGGHPMPNQKMDLETEKQGLKHQAEMLQTKMANIQKRLDEMESAGQGNN